MLARIRNNPSFPAVAIGASLVGTVAYGARRFYTAQPINLDSTPGFKSGSSPTKAFVGFLPVSFRTLTLQSTEQVNHNTKKLTFRLSERAQVSGLGLTSALLSIHIPNGGVLPVIRPYTPISNLNEPGVITFMIKRYPDGKASGRMHELQPGQQMTFAGPIKGYDWSPNKHSHIGLIAGGAGITPIYQLARGILENPEDKTKISLVFGVNSEQDVLLKQEFEEYERRYPDRFKAHYTVSNAPADSTYTKGYVDKDLLKKTLPRPGTGENVKLFLCGPPKMEEAFLGKKGWFSSGSRGILGDLGYDKGQIFQF